MPKHNIDAIAAATIAAHDAYTGTDALVTTVHPSAERVAAERIRVLEAIHGEPKKDQAGGTEDERRADRLFTAIVKALTVRL